jgi:hypothetical protein
MKRAIEEGFPIFEIDRLAVAYRKALCSARRVLRSYIGQKRDDGQAGAFPDTHCNEPNYALPSIAQSGLATGEAQRNLGSNVPFYVPFYGVVRAAHSLCLSITGDVATLFMLQKARSA